MHSLIGKVAIVTGASSGIGRAAAVLFAQHGAKVVLGARRHAVLEGVATDIRDEGGHAIALPGDVTEEAYARDLVGAAIATFGGLDIAFNNAGTLGAMGDPAGVSRDAWQETLDTNLTSAFFGAKHQIPAMLDRRGGSVIFTGTFVGHTTGLPGMAAYAASKAGLIGLTRTLAAEYGPRGIRVNTLLPGGTDTAMAPDDEDALAFIRNKHALKRIATPGEIARSALYLASDMSSFTTGAAMLVDGGVSMNWA